MEMFFLFLGLGFFIYIMSTIRQDDSDRYARRLNEMREFGYREVQEQHQQNFKE